MRSGIFFFIILCSSLSASAQYRNDNVLYKTVDPVDLCPVLDKSKGYLFLDVRSKGENQDTSSSPGLNIGRLKGAKNIDIRELGARLQEIREYMDQPVFVYCSHSQRSRRASKILADSGFTNVYNINGGLTALYNYAGVVTNCPGSIIETSNQYGILSPAEFCNRISGNKKAFILDVRTDSAFRHISRDAKINAMGYFQGSVNIPLSELDSRLTMIPEDKEIFVVDLFGGDAAKASAILKQRGYKNVFMLLEGVNRWLASYEKELPCKNSSFKSTADYRIINSKDFGQLMQSAPETLLLDIRTDDEFANKSRDSWRNIGHLKNARHIPETRLKEMINDLEEFREKNIVIYSFGGGTETYSAAQTLSRAGFKKISVLSGGLFNIRWLAANDKTQAYLKEFVADVPEINW